LINVNIIVLSELTTAKVFQGPYLVKNR
jgi:hypothetical protein